MISSFGFGEIIYLVIRWPSLYYFLESGIEAYIASLISEVISTICYMITVSIFLTKDKDILEQQIFYFRLKHSIIEKRIKTANDDLLSSSIHIHMIDLQVKVIN